MRSRRIHLINPRTNSFTTRPLIFNRALYSPLAGLLAVAALIPQDQYEVVLTDENIEPIDFDLPADMVGISAMTSYVQRGYAIADEFRRRGVPVIMGGVHPTFMPDEALAHADAVVVGEAEYVMSKVLEDLSHGNLQGIYQAPQLHSMTNLPVPRYDLIKGHRYLNRSFIQTARGCAHGCTFCAEHLLNGPRFRYRPIDEVLHEIDLCGERVIALNDADFFGSPQRAMALMRALQGRNLRWQAGVNSRQANNDRLLELAARSGCFMLSIGFESISRQTLRGVHKYVNHPETYQALVEKIHSYGILVLGLFMFGFDNDDPSVFQETVRFNIQADFDMCAYSLLTPYPGTLLWFELLKQQRIVSCDWDKYDQAHIVFRTTLPADQLRKGHRYAYRQFYAPRSVLRRFPFRSSRSKLYWIIFNLFLKNGGQSWREALAPATPLPPYPARLPLPLQTPAGTNSS